MIATSAAAALAFLLAKTGLSYELTIHDANDLIDFSNKVNDYGYKYSGTTVYLDSDIYLPDSSFNPIGYNRNYNFRGTFDGQGHVISNLTITTTRQYAGLFGYSDGATIRNFVIDDKSFFTTTSTDTPTTTSIYVGGIIGYAYANYNSFIIENCVNMADVYYSMLSGSIGYLGGITGYMYTDSYSSTIRNCANYGPISDKRPYSYWYCYYMYIGGLVGQTKGHRGNITNCVNYGEVSVETQYPSYAYVGGIVGHVSLDVFNCVSNGLVSSPDGSYTGAIFGYNYDSYYYSNNFTNCFWTPEVGVEVGYNCSGIKPTLTEFYRVERLNETTAKILNSFTESGVTFSKWLLNSLGAEVTFYMNGIKYLVTTAKLILLPSPTETFDRGFYGWFINSDYKTLFTDTSVTKATELYGKIDKCLKVELISPGVLYEMTVKTGFPYGEFPNVKYTGYSLDRWFTQKDGKGEKITPETIVKETENHTLYTKWTINSYTLI